MTVEVVHEAVEANVDEKRRGRPLGTKGKPRATRRNFSRELADLERRVQMVVDLLTVSVDDTEFDPRALVRVAIKTLKG